MPVSFERWQFHLMVFTVYTVYLGVDDLLSILNCLWTMFEEFRMCPIYYFIYFTLELLWEEILA